jgi:hypothetical protein
MANMIKIARRRNSEYVVNFKMDGGVKRYAWAGSKGDKVDTKPIPEDVVNHLLMSSRCFTDGELVIVSDSEEAKEIISNIDNLEKYTNNTHSRADIEKILNASITSMKKELNKITVDTEKSFVIDVAVDMKLDSASKREFLGTWMGTPADILFAEED